MKTKLVVLFIMVLLPLVAAAQASTPDRISIPLSSPDRPAMLNVGLMTGGITVKAYNGKEIIVDVKQQVEEDVREQTKDGLRRIPNTSSGLRVEEDNNEVTVSTGYRGMNSRKHLVIQVPVHTSLKLSTVNDGDIDVEGVNGEIEVNNTNGSVLLKNISESFMNRTPDLNASI